MEYKKQGTGIQHDWFRYYDPKARLNLSPKSRNFLFLTLIDVQYSILLSKNSVQEYNIYLYTKNDPVNYNDFLGLYCGSGVSDLIVPDSPYGFNFGAACIWHDNCYGLCEKSKASCDKEFLNRMRNICNRYDNKLPYPYSDRSACLRTADTYYIAVVLFGRGPYYRAQRAGGCCPKERHKIVLGLRYEIF
jgi:hypothetical protein